MGEKNPLMDGRSEWTINTLLGETKLESSLVFLSVGSYFCPMRRRLLLSVSTLLAGCSFTADFEGYTFGRNLDAGPDSVVGDSGPGDGGPGDGGPDATLDETPPMVVSTLPSEGANLLDGRARLSFVFDEAIVAGDVNVELDATVAVVGEVLVEGDTLHFVPASPLVDGDYTVTVESTLTDVSGNPLAEPYVLAFTARQGATLRAFRPEAAFGSIRCPELLSDENGNVALSFMEGASLYFALYRTGEGWSEAIELSTNAQDAHMAVSPGGRVAVGYTATVSDVQRPVVRVATGLLSTEFEMAEFADDVDAPTDPLSPPPEGSCSNSSRSMAVAVNDSGAVALMWRTAGPSTLERFGWARNLRNADGEWGEIGSTQIAPINSGRRERPAIAMDSMGRVESVHLGSDESSDPGFVFLAYNGSEWNQTNRPFRFSGSNVPPQVRVQPDDTFHFLLTGYEFPTSTPTITEDVASARGVLVTSRVIGAAPGELAYSAGRDDWLAWTEDDRTIFGFRREGDGWDIGSAFREPRIPASARGHVLASFPALNTAVREARALLLYEDADEIYWVELADSINGPQSSGVGRLFSGGGEVQREPRLVFDEISNHGVLAFVGQDGGVLRVANFRGMLTGELTL